LQDMGNLGQAQDHITQCTQFDDQDILCIPGRQRRCLSGHAVRSRLRLFL